MTAVLALDQGTTGSTALVLSADGRVLGRGYREFTQHFPSPGEVEHDAEEILRVTVDAAREAIKQAGVTPNRSEERRVGKECRSRGWAYDEKKEEYEEDSDSR